MQALLIATTSAAYKTKNEMGYICCGRNTNSMIQKLGKVKLPNLPNFDTTHPFSDSTDYYFLTGTTSSDTAISSHCTAPAAPTTGIYATGDACATAGATLYSGWQCVLSCTDG
jgi:hypothetical protein